MRPLFADAPAEERSWFARHKVLPINHMVVVSRALADQRPDAVQEVRRVLTQAADSSAAAPRFSVDEMRRSLKLIVGYSAQQELIPRAFAVDELFDEATRALI